MEYENAGHAFAQCIEYDDEDDPHNYYNAAQMYIGAKMKPQAKLYLQMFLAKADKLKDEKEKAKLTAKVKEQLKGLQTDKQKKANYEENNYQFYRFLSLVLHPNGDAEQEKHSYLTR